MASMTQAESETFLAGSHVAVIGLEQPGRPPLLTPIWYHYAPGGVIGLWMDGESYKVKRLRKTSRLSLCVQDERRPYRYVSVAGDIASIGPIDFERDLVPLVARYLEGEERSRYLADLGGPEGVVGDVYVTVTPRHWRGEDLSR